MYPFLRRARARIIGASAVLNQYHIVKDEDRIGYSMDVFYCFFIGYKRWVFVGVGDVSHPLTR